MKIEICAEEDDSSEPWKDSINFMNLSLSFIYQFNPKLVRRSHEAQDHCTILRKSYVQWSPNILAANESECLNRSLKSSDVVKS